MVFELQYGMDILQVSARARWDWMTRLDHHRGDGIALMDGPMPTLSDANPTLMILPFWFVRLISRLAVCRTAAQTSTVDLRPTTVM